MPSLARFAHLALALLLAGAASTGWTDAPDEAAASPGGWVAPAGTTDPWSDWSDGAGYGEGFVPPVVAPLACDVAPELCETCGGRQAAWTVYDQSIDPWDPGHPEYDPSTLPLEVDHAGCVAPPPPAAEPCRETGRLRKAAVPSAVRSPAEEAVIASASLRAETACRAVGEAHASEGWLGMAVFVAFDPAFPRWRHTFYLPLGFPSTPAVDPAGGTLRFAPNRGGWQLRKATAETEPARWIDLHPLPGR